MLPFSTTEWSWELRTWSHKMTWLDVLSTSPLYFCRKRIGATNENSNFDLRGFTKAKHTKTAYCAGYAGSGSLTILDVSSTIAEAISSQSKKFQKLSLTRLYAESRTLFFREARANKRRQYKCICPRKKILVWLSLVRPKMMSLGVETQILRDCCFPILGLVKNFPWVSYPVFRVEKPFMNNDYWASQLEISIKMFIKATNYFGPQLV